jgi:hypothetical protein
MNGRMMAKGVLRENVISLNSKKLKSGQYIFVIRGKSGIKSFIFIKKE